MIGVVAGGLARAEHLIEELGLQKYPKGTALAISTRSHGGRGAGLETLIFDESAELTDELKCALLPCLRDGQAYRLERLSPMDKETAKDQLIKELKVTAHQQEVVINTLRSLLFMGWNLTNTYEQRDED